MEIEIFDIKFHTACCAQTALVSAVGPVSGSVTAKTAACVLLTHRPSSSASQRYRIHSATIRGLTIHAATSTRNVTNVRCAAGSG
jgi:hypothetical protein